MISFIRSCDLTSSYKIDDQLIAIINNNDENIKKNYSTKKGISTIEAQHANCF